MCLHACVCRQLRAGRDARTQVAMSEMAAFSAQQRAAKQAAHATVIQKVFRGGRVRRMIKVQRRAAARVLLLLPLLLPVQLLLLLPLLTPACVQQVHAIMEADVDEWIPVESEAGTHYMHRPTGLTAWAPPTAQASGRARGPAARCKHADPTLCGACVRRITSRTS